MTDPAPIPAPPTKAHTSGLAIAALVLGLLWVGGIGSILALVFGVIAIGQIKRSEGQITGRGMALAGAILGGLGVVVIAGLVIAWPHLPKKLDRSQLESTLSSQLQSKTGIQDLSVTCPDDEPVKEGATFTCTVISPTGGSGTIMVTQTDDEGHVSWKLTGAQAP